nr:hypothetical protein GCM10020092_068590 [Actinoplanes digitatis]
MSRLIRYTGQQAIYLAGPGHGGPALVAAGYLEGAYTEIYPKISQDEAGMLRLFRQFSSPGGIPSHVSVTTPGSIHEGGELGYVLVHAFGAVMDNPDLLAIAVVGDGEAETGPLEGSWKGVSFLNPKHDGAVLPILHLNGAKIAEPDRAGPQGPERGTRPAPRPRLRRGRGRGRRRARHALPLRRRAGHRLAADPRDPDRGPRGRLGRQPADLADDRPAVAEGLDRAGRGRRRQGHRYLALAPGTALRRTRQPGAPGDARALAQVVPSGGALRPHRRAQRPDPGAVAEGRPADERHPARQRRPAHPRPGPARLPRLRPGRGRA